MAAIKKYPDTIKINPWCPGCGHPILNRLLQEVILEKDLGERYMCMAGVGCGSMQYISLNRLHAIECHHGRAPSTAYGYKLLRPNNFIYTVQGDGVAYAIGMGETMLAAYENHPITIIVVNNGNYGMTGGQMAPTTIPGQKTTTCIHGRDDGLPPIDIMRAIKTIDQVKYAARGSTASLSEIIKLKKYLAKAIDCQMNEKCFSMIEVLCQCPTNWHMTLPQSVKHMEEKVYPLFPLGEFKNEL